MNDNTWTWMGGGSSPNQLGVYGEKDIPNSENYPGSHEGAVALYDCCTHSVLLFGGIGLDDFFEGAY